MKKILLITFIFLLSIGSWGQIAAWDFFGESNQSTSTADVFDQNLNSSALVTRGSGASASTGNNSFRTLGFKNDGISVSNTDYFEVTLCPSTGYKLTLTTIDANLSGTGTFAASPGVTSQFAYSIDGINFILIGTPQITIGIPATLSQVSLSEIPSLQNISAETTITIRYYASGQTTTGGWGFISSAAGIYGLAINGSIESAGSALINASASSALTESNLNNSVINLSLTNETYVASLQSSYFTLNNAPTGTSIQSVSRVSATEASITLAFNGTDFDEDVTNFNITASTDALTGADALTSNNLTITAHTAPLATSNVATNTLNGNATLNGTVTSKGYATTVTFEYSTDATLTTGVTELTASQSPLGADAVSAAVSYILSGLNNGETYYYRVKAVNSEGTTLGAIQSFSPIAPPTLFISEVTHPSNAAFAKFVELYNYGSESIDLSALLIFLARQSNGGTINSITLTGTIAPGTTFVIAGNEATFKSNFSKEASIYHTNVDGNGNDGYFLYVGGNHSTGTLFDTYGVINEDGSGKPWYYANSKAVRKITVTTPNPTWTASEWVIVSSTTERMSPGLFPATVWNGSTNNSWTEASNWDNGTPATTTDVVIWGGASNFPYLESATTVRDLIFKHNAQLNGQENLTVTGTTTVQHQIDFSTTNDPLDKWQYFTSPFNGITAGNMLSSNERVDLYMIQYDNTLEPSEDNRNSAWAWLEETSDAISSGTGYAVTAVNDILEVGDNISTSYYNMALSGTLVSASSNVTVGLSYNGANATDNNWNLIGNPFLAPIEWTSSSYTGNIQGGTAYIYDRTKTEGGNYISIQDGVSSPSSYGTYIPAMQGFFVSAAGTGNIEISPSARVNNTQNFYKSQENKALLRIQLSDGTKTDETVIVFNEMAEAKFDSHDALKMLGSQQNPQIYTTVESGHKLVFNNTNDLSQTIDLQITAPTEGTYTIGFSEISGLFNDYNISITDYKHQKSLSITDTQYQFEVDETNQVLNFSLAFAERTGFNEHIQQSLKVYAQHGEIIIKSANDHSGTVSVYTLAGKKLTSQTVSGTYSLIDFNNKQGVYVVEHKGAINTTYHKVVINQ